MKRSISVFVYFDSTQLKDLGRELHIYIYNVRADERFANLNTIFELANMMVATNKDEYFSLVCHPIAIALVERCFSTMKIVKTLLRIVSHDEFMNDCIICFVEQGFLATVPTNDVIVQRTIDIQKRNQRRQLLL